MKEAFCRIIRIRLTKLKSKIDDILGSSTFTFYDYLSIQEDYLDLKTDVKKYFCSGRDCDTSCSQREECLMSLDFLMRNQFEGDYQRVTLRSITLSLFQMREILRNIDNMMGESQIWSAYSNPVEDLTHPREILY